jgi:hypothetical protein
MSTPAGENPGEDSRRAGNLPVLLLHPWWGITPAVNKWTADLATAGGQQVDGRPRHRRPSRAAPGPVRRPEPRQLPVRPEPERLRRDRRVTVSMIASPSAIRPAT